jgi:hypothetical protein
MRCNSCGGGTVVWRYETTNFCPTSRASDRRGFFLCFSSVCGSGAASGTVVALVAMTSGLRFSSLSSPRPKHALSPPAEAVTATPEAGN